MSTLKELLAAAKPHGLEMEVCISVIEYMEDTPNPFISDAIMAAAREWDL
jgi:hypothetical protein